MDDDFGSNWIGAEIGDDTTHPGLEIEEIKIWIPCFDVLRRSYRLRKRGMKVKRIWSD